MFLSYTLKQYGRARNTPRFQPEIVSTEKRDIFDPRQRGKETQEVEISVSQEWMPVGFSRTVNRKSTDATDVSLPIQKIMFLPFS